MAQILTIMKKQPDGTEAIEKVTVLRAWSDSSGAQIFLFADGSYGYKDKAPVRAAREFDIIGSVIQRQLALNWWNMSGAKKSATFYAGLESDEKKRMGDFQEALGAGSVTELDMILYRKRAADRKGAAVSNPMTWMECGFAKRPDWWGQMVKAETREWVYEMVEMESREESAAVEQAAQTPAEKTTGEPEAPADGVDLSSLI